MIKRRIPFLIICLVAYNISFSQIVELAKDKYYDGTLNSTVLVVLKYSDSLNKKIKSSFEKYWTVTPYKFVNSNYKDTLKTGAKIIYSVFDGNVVRVVQVNMERPGDLARGTPDSWPGYYLVPLDQQKKEQVDLIAVRGPVNSFYFEWTPESGFENTYYRVDYIVKSMNDGLQFLKFSGKKSMNDYEKQVNRKTATLKDRTLLIPAELIKEYDINRAILAQMSGGFGGKVIASKKPVMQSIITEKVLSEYKGKYKILPFAEIEKIAETDKAPEYALFTPLINDLKFLFIYTLDKKELIYIEKDFMSQKVKEKDLKALNKAAGL
jgi:hypothetical protein